MCENLYFTKMCHKMGYVFTVPHYKHCIYNRMFHVLEFLEAEKCRRPREIYLNKVSGKQQDISDWCIKHDIDIVKNITVDDDDDADLFDLIFF